MVDDFGHHPTAIRETLRALRIKYPTQKVWAIFEPRTNTTRRNIFQAEIASAFVDADAVVVAQVGVHAEVVVVVPALEVLVVEDGGDHLRPHVGAQDLRGDARVVGHRHRLADVVAERGHHQFVVRSRPLGPGGRLEAVGQLVHGEAVDDVGQ